MLPEIKEITSINTREEFERVAMEVFRFQARHCAPYATYLELLEVNGDAIKSVDEIPYMPIEFFKSHTVYCAEKEPEKIFTSSSTGSDTPSKHHVARIADYEECFFAAFNRFYGEKPIYALLPCYLEREGSSLVYMADRLIARYGGGFYLNDYERLIADMAADPREKILLGVSYALWDLAEIYAPHLTNTIVMETGGMKGRREEISKSRLHEILCGGLGVEQIHSEYGMAELMSQAYSYGRGVFMTPPWMSVRIRDINDPFTTMPAGRSGGVDIIDLGNLYSCAFIETQDMGKMLDDGRFELSGRIDRSQIRGCNLLIQ